MSSAKPTKQRRRAVLYLRVSTKRQAEHELSLTDQLDRCEACAVAEDADVVQIFTDNGRSAHGDALKRPKFQEMIRFVRDPANQVDLVIGYSLSRLFRRLTDFVNYREELEREGIRLLSATQSIPDGPNGRLMANIIAMFDDHASEVNASTVRDVMIANAEAGYWNGSAPPLGYKTVVATVLRKKEKKILVEEPVEAALVNRIFRLYVHGEPGSGLGRIGMKAIAKYLNTGNIRWRGRLFTTSFIEDVLGNEAISAPTITTGWIAARRSCAPDQLGSRCRCRRSWIASYSRRPSVSRLSSDPTRPRHGWSDAVNRTCGVRAMR